MVNVDHGAEWRQRYDGDGESNPTCCRNTTALINPWTDVIIRHTSQSRDGEIESHRQSNFTVFEPNREQRWGGNRERFTTQTKHDSTDNCQSITLHINTERKEKLTQKHQTRKQKQATIATDAICEPTAKQWQDRVGHRVYLSHNSPPWHTHTHIVWNMHCGDGLLYRKGWAAQM